ncbi:hypothetical protein Pfo_008182 [Paulownia fortunei]|nr:hypothetical protein Pfo_008182 [Paulownia fortunei]
MDKEFSAVACLPPSLSIIYIYIYIYTHIHTHSYTQKQIGVPLAFACQLPFDPSDWSFVSAFVGKWTDVVTTPLNAQKCHLAWMAGGWSNTVAPPGETQCIRAEVEVAVQTIHMDKGKDCQRIGRMPKVKVH